MTKTGSADTRRAVVRVLGLARIRGLVRQGFHDLGPGWIMAAVYRAHITSRKTMRSLGVSLQVDEVKRLDSAITLANQLKDKKVTDGPY